MFEAGDWDEAGEDQPQLSALSWALAQSQPKQGNSVEKTSSKKKKKYKKEFKENEVEKPQQIQNVAKRLVKSVEKELDKVVNSPTATRNLLDDNDDSDDNDDDGDGRKSKKKKRKLVEKVKTTTEIIADAGKKIGRSLSDSSLKDPGYLLKLGEKFSSTDAFLRFVGLPGKSKKGLKRQRQGSEINSDETSSSPKEELTVNEGLTSENEKENDVPDPPPRKKRKGNSLDLAKVREILSKEETKSPSGKTSSSAKTIHKTLAEEARNKLTASRFRYLNEQLYTQPSNAAVKLFNSDSTLFSAYHQVSSTFYYRIDLKFSLIISHQGYQHQAKQWPLDPLNVIITDLLRQDSKSVIADLGCGEARLSRSVPNPVHSFDLVAVNEDVTVADIAHLPLEDASVDIVVFCLSLMGTNIRDFVFEASRILKIGGSLKVAELESRFHGEDMSVDKFIQDVEKFGFQISWKDLKKDFFYFINFKKVTDVKKKKKLPELSLKACIYKKR